MSHSSPLRIVGFAASLVAPCAIAAAQNRPPNTPTITEPSAANLVLNPNDVHMETSPFSDPDPADTHAATDWEIWTVAPQQRVWAALGVTGPEKVHAHLGDGAFEGSHLGWSRLFANTAYTLRVRHRDSSGVAATQWSQFAQRPFSTGAASIVEPLVIEDVAAVPPPLWADATGTAVDLPTGAPNPMLRLETAAGWLLLRIDGSPLPGNRVTNPLPLPVHQPVRLVVDAGSVPLVLPATDLTIVEHDCEAIVVRLPALNLAARQVAVLWISDSGACFTGQPGQRIPDFSTPARGQDVPWAVREPGYSLEVVASGLRMPVNIAFVPQPGTQPGDPRFYVTELYGTVRVVTNDGTLLTYATGLLNYTPSGAFPGSGEQGLTGLAVDPVSGDVFVSHLWRTGTQNFPRITRLVSTNGGLTSSSRSVILDMQGESQGQSHQVSNLEIVGGQLYCHMGDGFTFATAQNLASYRGKILRLNLDGTPIPSNPFYNGGTVDSRDYVYAYGVRNPFGGAWRASDGSRYVVENGPEVDRFAKIVAGRNYLWNDTNASMRNFALYNWDPSSGPVNLAFVQPQTFGGSGFPAAKMDHAFVTESGATYAQGQQAIGKRISEFVLDAAGNRVAGPIPFVEYTGTGYASAVALAAGPDGLYFSEFYADPGTGGPTATGSRILRVRFGDASDCDRNGRPDWCEIATGTGTDCNGNGLLDVCDLAAGTSHDFDGNGRPDECDPLFATTDRLSVTTGGRVDFVLDGGAANAGLVYELLGSITGTAPGTPFGAVTLPLNSLGDPWFALTSAVFSPAVLQNTMAPLDAAGHGAAALVLGPLPAGLLGLRIHHAFLVVDPITGQARMASNAVPLVLAP